MFKKKIVSHESSHQPPLLPLQVSLLDLLRRQSKMSKLGSPAADLGDNPRKGVEKLPGNALSTLVFVYVYYIYNI